MIGARDREVKMWVDPGALEKYGLTVDDIRNTLQSQSLDMPAGFSTQGSRELSVKVRGEARTIEDLKHLVVPSARGDLELGTIVRVPITSAAANVFPTAAAAMICSGLTLKDT